jgi:hypothetical protein
MTWPERLLVTTLLSIWLGLAGHKTAYALTPCPAAGAMPPAGQCCVDAKNVKNSCAVGDVPDTTTVPGDCACVSANKALKDLFDIVNGIMIPITVLLGMFLIILAGYKILTSQGDPAKLQEGKDSLTSAIIGLLFVVMAVSILRVILKALITGDNDPFS